MREILPGIYELPLESQGDPGVKAIKLFLIPGKPGSRSLLLDTGFKTADCLEKLQEALAALQISVTDLDVFLTHRHHDHCGLCSILAKQGAVIYMNPEEERHAYDCLSYKLTAESLEAQKQVLRSVGVTYECAPEIFSFFRRIQEKIAAHGQWVLASEAFPYRAMQAGDAFDYGDYRFRALALPGHTRGQLGLIERDKKIVFSADQLINGMSPIVATTYPDEGLLTGFFQSLEWIKHNCREGWRIFPAHGEEIKEVGPAVDQTVFSYLTKLSKARNVLRTEGVLPDGSRREFTCRHISEAVYGIQKYPETESDFFKYKMTLTKTYSLLEYLHDEGFLTRREQDGIFFWALKEQG